MKNKSKLTKIAIVAIISVVLIAAAIFTVITIKNNNDKKQQEAAKQTPAAKKASATEAKMNGVEAAQKGETDKAKELLLEAKSEYEALGDTDNVVDTDAQLYFIEHPSTPPAAPELVAN